ncbi:unnamed protein product [Ciceribacter sp. T2.26MG-112.2]|nr:unnamed protein product [Ciceribacter naphthalenivorans]
MRYISASSASGVLRGSANILRDPAGSVLQFVYTVFLISSILLFTEATDLRKQHFRISR